VIQRNSALS